ncbi:unnamed protein product, partial [Ceratitis capitata]
MLQYQQQQHYSQQPQWLACHNWLVVGGLLGLGQATRLALSVRLNVVDCYCCCSRFCYARSMPIDHAAWMRRVCIEAMWRWCGMLLLACSSSNAVSYE